jgi:hypothetical protein
MPTKTQQPAAARDDASRSSETRERAPLATPAAPLAAGPAFASPPDGVSALQATIGNRALASALEGTDSAVVRRQCADCAAGRPCQKCAEEGVLRRSPAPGAAAPGPGPALPAALTTALSQTGGQGLDGQARRLMESRFGLGLGHVRIHADAAAARAADSVDASAFTLGRDIWFGSGQYRPGQSSGLHLLAHELAHTVQQRGRPAAAQASLRVGSVHDPAEAAADRAADAVLANRSVASPGSSAGAVIRRKPKVSAVPDNAAARIVELDDGKRYRVVRTVKLEQTTEEVPASGPTLKGQIDKDNIWLQVDWCKERQHRGQVKVGANLPAGALSVLKDLGQSILDGSDPKEAILKTKVEPFATVTIVQSKRFRLDVTGKATVEPFGGKASGGSVGATLKLPNFEVGAEFKLNEPPKESGRTGPDWQVGLTAKITWGGAEAVKCPHKMRTIVFPRISYSCQELVPAHEEQRPEIVTRTQSHYLYFEYMKKELAAKAPGAKLNATEMAALRQALADGYKVTAIRGYASPEGPMDPTARFIGNRALSQERADAARDWVEKECPPPSLLSMRAEGQSCFATGLKPTGEGELYGTDEEGRELKGRPLATSAVGKFGAEGAEERHRTPEVTEELEKRKKSPERQTDVVYPLLRRAEIEMSKQVTEMKTVQVGPSERQLATCPSDVLQAAEEDFERTSPVKR